MKFAGIDPGIDGCMAVINEDKTVEFFDVPTLTKVGDRKTRRVFDESGMAEMVGKLIVKVDGPDNIRFTVEAVHAFPARHKGPKCTACGLGPENPCPECGLGPKAQGSVGVFGFGEGYGIWKGILAAMFVERQFIDPRSWKKVIMPSQANDKDASRAVAMKLYPDSTSRLARKMDHNRADALLISEFGKRTYQPEFATRRKSAIKA